MEGSMRYANCMKTAIGGLSLVLVLSACSSGSKSQKTAAASSPSTTEASSPKPKASAVPQDMPRSDVVSDRGTTIGPSYSAIDYPSDRTGPSDRSPEITAACPSRTDAQGKVVFDDPSCPDRYRRQAGGISDKDHAGLAAACPSRIDTSGNTVYVYDDPTCPRRYRHQISSIREARISLSRAAGIKKWDEPSAVAGKERAALAAACPSQVDATGSSVYDDPSCPERYRRQKENIDDRAALVAACSSHVDATGKIIYDDPACLTRNRYLAQESAYYDRYIDKAVKHARTAEIAGNQGNVADMLENAQLSLEHAKEARRAGNNADLAAGILALRQTIAYGQGQGNDVTTTTVSRSRTVKGELSRGEKSSRVGGGEQYVVRDNQNREMPISLSPEMSRQVQVGDVVEAQVDSNGQVTSITKAQ